jgi:pyruvate/2-oxoglutarate dehydrogenase complex dihydrolipoamide acyltransferase (E2) component
MATTIKMPQLGESVTEGTIERWLVKEGDTVEQYDPLFEVVTDKVNAEVPAEIGGTISKILIPDGETVAVGTAVAEIDAEGGGAAAEAPAAEAPGEATAGAPGEPTAGAPGEPTAEAPAEPTAEAAPAEAPAAQAAAGQPAAEPAPAVETPAPAASADDGAAEMEQGPATAPAPAPDASAAPAPAAPTPAAAAPATQVPSPAAADANGGAARMTPAVRRLVREHGIDIAALQGSGAGGRVTRDDVMAFIAKGTAAPSAPAETAAPQAAASQAAAAPAEPASTAAPAQPTAAVRAPTPAPAAAPTPPAIPAPSGGDTELPLSQMRKGIAKKMTQVKQTVPHAYTVVEVDMTNVVKWREANNMAFKAREGASLSYVAVVVKAVTETLRKHPTLNSQFADDKIILKQAMNVGIAVAVDNGLIVPVIHDADQLSISGVNARIRDISSRAHAGKLRLDELQGGTFTVNNTGWFGSVSSMPIINAPEVAILSMEAIVKRPRVMEIDGADVIAIRHMMNMTCSFDHRVLDGAQVGFFLADVRKFLEEWDANTSIG